MLGEILKHLLKAKLYEEVSPGETSWIVLDYGCFCHGCYVMSIVPQVDESS